MAVAQALVQALATASAGSTNRVLSFASNVTQGNLLVAAISYTSVSGQPTVSDTLSNNWTEVGAISSTLNGTLVTLILFWAQANAGGACTVTGGVSGITSPTGVWMVIGEFSGANSLAIISGSALGFGVNPPLGGGNLSSRIQATNPPLTTPTGALLIVVGTTGNGTATWTIDPQNNWYTLAAQGGGIVLAYTLNLYNGAPFCDMTPPTPMLNETGDGSTQWVVLSAPFTTTALPPPLTPIESFDIQRFQYPPYPYKQ
jgi:hypothetical protein